nr:MAG TPA: hypothetical protein [Caudoviricetes sp.]
MIANGYLSCTFRPDKPETVTETQNDRKQE